MYDVDSSRHFATQHCFPMVAEKMKGKRIAMSSIALATLMLVSLFAAVSSAASVSGTVMAGTGPAGTTGVVMRVLVAVDTSGHVW